MNSAVRVVAASLVALAHAGPACAQARAPAQEIRSVDWRNRTYDYGAGVIRLRSGKGADGTGAGVTYSMRPEDIAYGDLDADGQEDAVVRIRLTAGTSLRGFELQAYALRDGRPARIARMDESEVSGDVRGVFCCAGRMLDLTSEGHVIFDVLNGQAFLRPTARTVFDYVVRDGEFVRRGGPTRATLGGK